MQQAPALHTYIFLSGRANHLSVVPLQFGPAVILGLTMRGSALISCYKAWGKYISNLKSIHLNYFTCWFHVFLY